MTRTHRYALLGLGFSLLAAPAWGAANATLTVGPLQSVDPACDQPVYLLEGTADFTTNDSGTGVDSIALVVHDGSGYYHDVDYIGLSSIAEPFATTNSFVMDLPFAGFLGSRPLVVRVHDIPFPASAPFADTKAGLELASDAPVLFELTIDPAQDASVCAAKSVRDGELRIESLKNGGGQTATSLTALDLDGAGTTDLTIAVPEDATLAAFFRAECSNNAANNGSWANVDLRVDGVAIPPTLGSDDALCTSNGTSTHDEWVMARTSAAQFVPGPSVRTVQVYASAPVGGAARLHDTELVVMVPEPAAWQHRVAGLAALVVLLRWRTRGGRRHASIGPWLGLAVLSVAIAEMPVRADTVVEGTQRVDDQIFQASAGTQFLDLGSGTSFPITLARPTRVAIVFAAECSVLADGFATWLNVDILVDGLAVPDSGDTDDAFCASNDGGLDDWVSASMAVTIDLDDGPHSISVRATLQSPTSPNNQWSLGGLHLSVVGQEH